MMLVILLSAVGSTAVMCNGNTPLNDREGTRLFCGRGPQRVTCPAGSTCEIEPGDAYAVCCPNLPATSSKCTIGVPLTGSNGAELFCGRGPNRVDCPSNSMCVIDPGDRFAVCCPQSRSVSVGSSTCPPGTSPVNCFVNPCMTAQCAVPGARCQANYCGGCHAMWYGPSSNLITECGTGPCPSLQSCANPGANCRYENPPSDLNGCVTGCGTLVCDFRNPASVAFGKGKTGKNGKGGKFGSNRVILPG